LRRQALQPTLVKRTSGVGYSQQPTVKTTDPLDAFLTGKSSQRKQTVQSSLFEELGAARGLNDEEDADELGEVGPSAQFERELKALQAEGVLLPEEHRRRELKRFDFNSGTSQLRR